MSYLGGLLEFEEGASLTGIRLQPLAREIASSTGTIYMHVVMLPRADNSKAASGAVSRFLPATLATIEGNQTDGSTWFATFQLALDDRDTLRIQRTADAAILRALDLTGLDDDDVWGTLVTVEDLRAVYDEVGDVSNWTIADLLTGLLIELTNTDLADVVGDDPNSAAADASEFRRGRFRELLDSWAATYEGPDE